MNRLILAACASLALASPAFAQTDTQTGDLFRPAADPMELLASNLIGMRVYRSETALDPNTIFDSAGNWDDLGEINDILLTRDGKVNAVLLNLGGFLGVGEHRVAVNMAALAFVDDASTPDDGADFFVVLTAPKDALQNSPVYGQAESAAATPPPRAPTVREGFAPTERTALTTEMLTGATVYDPQDNRVGEVSDLVLGEDGSLQAVVVDVGGFLGIGERPVALDLGGLDILRAEGGEEVRVYVPLTREELDALPVYQK